MCKETFANRLYRYNSRKDIYGFTFSLLARQLHKISNLVLTNLESNS